MASAPTVAAASIAGPAGAARGRLVVATAEPTGCFERFGALLRAAQRAGHPVTVLAPGWPASEMDLMAAQGVNCADQRFAHGGINPLTAYRVRRDLERTLAMLSPAALLIEAGEALIPVAAAAARAGVGRVRVRLNGDERADRASDLPAGVGVFATTAEQARQLAAARQDLGPIMVWPAATLPMAEVPFSPLPAAADGLLIRCITGSDDVPAHQTFQAAARAAAQIRPDLSFATGRSLAQMAGARLLVHLPGPGGPDRLILQAAALGRPLIVADLPGLRELVDERVNGWRVRPGDVARLRDAMLSAAACADILPALGRASRAKVERGYDEGVVIAGVLAAFLG